MPSLLVRELIFSKLNQTQRSPIRKERLVCCCNGNVIYLTPLGVTQVFANTLYFAQWTVLVASAPCYAIYTPWALWVIHLCFTTVLVVIPGIRWNEIIHFSGLSSCTYSVKLHMLILVSCLILFSGTFNRHRMNAFLVTFIFLVHLVRSCIFLTFSTQINSHKNNWGLGSCYRRSSWVLFLAPKVE